MKRILCLIMAFIMLICGTFMIACGGTGDTQTDTPTSDVQTEPSPDDMPALIFDTETVYYTLIRGSYAGKIETQAAVDLNKAIKECYTGNGKTSIKEDFFAGQKKGEFYDIEGCEILVGLTNRKESSDVYSELSEHQYVIKKVGEKLVIIGYDEYATAAAVAAFIEKYLSSPADKLELEATIEMRGEFDLRTEALNENATYRIMTWNLGCMVSEDNNGEVECIDIITRNLPDIIGLQECNSKVYNKVLSELPAFYKSAKEKHSGTSTVNYTPIIYNTNLFKLIKTNLVWLRGRYTGTNTKSLSWAVLEDNNGQKLAVINFHGAVCSKSYTGFAQYTAAQLNQQAHEWKLDNVAQVIEIKNMIISEFGNIPIMVTGDNNFNSASEQYAIMMADGFTDAEHTARISAMTGFKTSYGYGSIPGEGLSIDHVFGLGGIDFVTHTIVRGDDVWKASDHCPVYVDFNLK